MNSRKGRVTVLYEFDLDKTEFPNDVITDDAKMKFVEDTLRVQFDDCTDAPKVSIVRKEIL